MNIIIYSHYYPAPEGLKTRKDTLIVHYFAKELVNLGHTVQVFFLSSIPVQNIMKNGFQDIIPYEKDYIYEGVPVHLIRYQSLTPHRSFPEKFQAKIINKQLRKCKDKLGWKADRVYVHFPTEFTGLTEIFAEKAPTLGDFHNIDILIMKKKGGKRAVNFINQIDVWGYRNKRVYRALNKIGEKPMVHVLSGIDRTLLGSEDFVQNKVKSFSDKMHILYAGQLISLKNVDILINAVKDIEFPCDLTIVGDGPERERLESLVSSSDNIHFTGKLPRNETVQHMKDADVFIMLSSPETYGLVYLEAMGQGCITVASKGEGFDGLIVDGENGFLRQPGSVDEVKEVLNKIYYLNNLKKEQLAIKGYELAKSMTEDQMARRLLTIEGLE